MWISGEPAPHKAKNGVSRRVIGLVTAMVFATGGVTAATSTPALADDVSVAAAPTDDVTAQRVLTITNYYAQAQVDNNPGNGASSWVWGSNYRGTTLASVDYMYYDGSGGALRILPGTSESLNLPKDVWKFRICWVTEDHDPGDYYTWNCTGWAYF